MFKFNFLFSQVAAIVVGLIYRSYLRPCPKNTLLRHLVAILVGIILGYFYYGKQMWHLFFQSFVVYIGLLVCPRKYVHIFTIIFTMGYLSVLHINGIIYDYENYKLDMSM